MNSLNKQEELKLWDQLTGAGLVKGEMPQIVNHNSTWFIRVMQGFAGWLAALFLMGFIATVFGWIFDRDNAFLLITGGMIIHGIVYSLFKLDKQNEFLIQIGLAFNLTAQLMVILGFYQLIEPTDVKLFLTVFIYQILLVILIDNYISRILSTWFSLTALFACFGKLGIFDLSLTIAVILFSFVWIKDLSWKKHIRLWEPIGYGLAIALLLLNGIFLNDDGINDWMHINQISSFNPISIWINKLLVFLVFIYVFFKQVNQPASTTSYKNTLWVGLISLFLLALVLMIEGTNSALILLILGFAKQRKILFIMGVVSLLFFISWYYYYLDVTLLSKSMILISLGVCLILGLKIVNYLTKTPSNELANIFNKKQISSKKWVAASCMLVVLLAVNFNIYNKEQILEHGQKVLLELAPVDPRSIMQGDYMRLRFAVENQILENEQLNFISESNSCCYMLLNLDQNSVGTFESLEVNKLNQNQNQNQVKMQFRIRNNQIKLATNAFFFQEGTADIYEQARYGEFRVNTNGEILLNNLTDSSFKILGFNRPNN